MERIKFKDVAASVKRAKEWIMERVEAGELAECPCCERPVGYEQRLERLHVIELLRFARAANRQANKYGGTLQSQGIHVPTVLGCDAESYSQNCLSQLRYFGLVEPSGTKGGWWKLTPLGVSFLLGSESVPRAAWLFKSKLVHYVEKAGTVLVHDLVSPAEYDSYMKEGSAGA